MSITGHKSEKSVQRYLHKRRDNELFEFSNALQHSSNSSSSSSSIASSSNSVVHNTNINVINNDQQQKIEAPENKKMKLTVCGDTNTVVFDFQ